MTITYKADAFYGTNAERLALTTANLASGQFFKETDTQKSYRWNGSTWENWSASGLTSVGPTDLKDPITFGSPVSFLWLLMRGDMFMIDDKILTSRNDITDLAIECRGGANAGVVSGDAIIMARGNQDALGSVAENVYFNVIQAGASNQDYRLCKLVNNATTTLGLESVELTVGGHYGVRLSCVGTTIKAYRTDNFWYQSVNPTPKISVTDTNTAQGRWGLDNFARSWVNATAISVYLNTLALTAQILPASSPAPRPVKFYEVPVIGSGTKEDNFRADMPTIPGLSYSAVIKSEGNSGRPREYTAIVRLVETGRISEKILRAIEAVRGVKFIDRETAIKRAMQIDDKLAPHDFDDSLIGKGKDDIKQVIKDYLAHKRSTFGIEESESNAIHALTESAKGW